MRWILYSLIFGIAFSRPRDEGAYDNQNGLVKISGEANEFRAQEQLTNLEEEHPTPPEEEGPPNYARPVNAPSIQQARTEDPMAAYGRDGTKAKKNKADSISLDGELIMDVIQSTTQNYSGIKDSYEPEQNSFSKQISKATKSLSPPTELTENADEIGMSIKGKEVNGKQFKKKLQDNGNASKPISNNNRLLVPSPEKYQIRNIAKNGDEIMHHYSENLNNPTISKNNINDLPASPESGAKPPAYPHSKEPVFSPSSSEADKIVSSIITTALPNIYKSPRGKIRNDGESLAPSTSAELREAIIRPYSTEESVESTDGSGVNSDRRENWNEYENQHGKDTASDENDDLPTTHVLNGYDDNSAENFSGDDIDNASNENSEDSGTTVETTAEIHSKEKNAIIEDRYVTSPEGSGEEQAEESTDQTDKSDRLNEDEYTSSDKNANLDSSKKNESLKGASHSLIEGSAEDEESTSVDTPIVNQAHKGNIGNQSAQVEYLKNGETIHNKNRASSDENEDETEEQYSMESRITSGETVDDLTTTEKVLKAPSSEEEALWSDAAGYSTDKQSQGTSTAKPDARTKSPSDGPLVKVDSSTANDDITIAYEAQKASKQSSTKESKDSHEVPLMKGHALHLAHQSIEQNEEQSLDHLAPNSPHKLAQSLSQSKPAPTKHSNRKSRKKVYRKKITHHSSHKHRKGSSKKSKMRRVIIKQTARNNIKGEDGKVSVKANNKYTSSNSYDISLNSADDNTGAISYETKSNGEKKPDVIGFMEQRSSGQLKGNDKVETTTQWQYVTAPNERTTASSSLPIEHDEERAENDDSTILDSKEKVTKGLLSSDKTTTWHYLVSPEGITLTPGSVELNNNYGDISMKKFAVTIKPTIIYHKDHLEPSGYLANYESSSLHSAEFFSARPDNSANYDNSPVDTAAVRADLPTALGNEITLSDVKPVKKVSPITNIRETRPTTKKSRWRPYKMDCTKEVDDKGHLCIEWASGGLCESHRPTMFLFCRKTCLCTGPLN